MRCCITSPPYWGLRDYGTATWVGGDTTCAHKGRPKPRQDTTGSGIDKGRFAESRGTQPGKRAYSVVVREACPCGARRVDQQLGLEATPDEFIDRLVEVFAEVRRVLTADGTLWLNLGDSYISDHFQQNSRVGNWGYHSRIPGSLLHKRRGPSGRLKPKDLVGIPWRVVFALQDAGWWFRSDIIWHKPNPMPESVSDRPTKSHEYLFLLTKSRRYFYDADAIREPLASKTLTTFGAVRRPRGDDTGLVKSQRLGDTMPERRPRLNSDGSHAGANKRSVWTVATQPFKGVAGTVRRVRVAADEADGDTTRTLSPDCPVHAGSSGSISSDRRGHNEHIGNDPSGALLGGLAPTDQSHGGSLATTESSGLPDQSCSSPARPHSNQTHKTDHAPSTIRPCTPYAQTLGDIQSSEVGRGSSGSADRSDESSIGPDDSVCRPSAQTPNHSADMSSCCCEYYKEVTDKTSHFATFPPKLVEPCLLAGSAPGDVVLDPFCGAGTVGVVALRHGRRFVGLELNPDYVEMSRRRIEDDRPLFNRAAEGA